MVISSLLTIVPSGPVSRTRKRPVPDRTVTDGNRTVSPSLTKK
jgi:hypothetical protein